MICQRNLLPLKEDRTNMPLETDGEGIFQKCNTSVILKKVTILLCGRVVDSFDDDIPHCLN